METKSETTTTPSQSAARAANARRSNGPKTPMGKATSSMNAIKWGFFSKQAVLAGESQEEFEALRASLIQSLEPRGAAEELCVARIADASWRLKRCSAIESQLFFHELCHEQSQRESDSHFHQAIRSSTERTRESQDLRQELKELAQEPEYALGRVFHYDVSNKASFERLSRYEGMLDRILRFAFRDLDRLQRRRQELGGRENPLLRNDLTDLVEKPAPPLH